MRELIEAIPDVDVLLRLEPEELGAKLLFVLRRAADHQFHLGNMTGLMWEHGRFGEAAYPAQRRYEVDLALTESWAWLESQGLLVSAGGTNGGNGWRVLSRRALKFENAAEFANYAAARRLPREALHERIAGPVWAAFMRGEFDTAAFQAMKAVEVSVREASGLAPGDLGTKLMRKAFDVERGPLSDMASEAAERQALGDLFTGAIGTYKNPHSHRDVELADPSEAAEIVMLASHLLRIVDARVAARQQP